jgi:hypothetical protein
LINCIGLGKEYSSDPSPYAHPKKPVRLPIDWKKEARNLFQDDANNYGTGPGWMLITPYGSGFENKIRSLLGNPRAKKMFDDGRLLGLEFEVDDKFFDPFHMTDLRYHSTNITALAQAFQYGGVHPPARLAIGFSENNSKGKSGQGCFTPTTWLGVSCMPTEEFATLGSP